MKNDKYLQDLRTLETLCQTAMNLSITTDERVVSSWREEYASYIFTKICVTTIAVLKLLPKSAYYVVTNNIEIWDISSVCTLARSLIDTYNIFHYLIIEEVDEDELKFRFALWKLHSKCERLKMLELIKSTSHELNKLKEDIKLLKKELMGTKFYQRLDFQKCKKLKDFRLGKKSIFLTNSQICKKAGISPDYYNAAYKYLSNYVHTYPFSISQIAAFKAGDTKSLALLEGAINYCTGYLCLAIRDFVKVFPDQLSNLASDIIKIIKNWEYILKFELRNEVTS